MIDTNELRKLTQAATPGPWISCGPSFGESLPKYLNEVVVDREGDYDDGYSVCTTPIGLEDQCSDDMAFIAAANPAAVSELLDRLEAAEKERDAAELMSLALRAKIEQMGRQEPVAKVESWTNGSYTRHYKLKWLRDVGEGAALFALPGAQPAPSAPEGWIQRGMAELEAIRSRLDDDTLLDDRTLIERIGKAMLAAAPEAKP